MKKNKSSQLSKRRRIIRNIVLMIAITAIILRIALFIFADTLTIEYEISDKEYLVLPNGFWWPTSYYCSPGHRLYDNFFVIHSERGYTPVFRKTGQVEHEICNFEKHIQELVRFVLISNQSLFKDSKKRPSIELDVGDSNIQINFSHLLQKLSQNVIWRDSIGIGAHGPDAYDYAVSEWLREEKRINVLLLKYPDLDLTVNVFITPHNDLENLKGKKIPQRSRLSFPSDHSVQNKENYGIRDFFRLCSDLLFITYKERCFIRFLIREISPRNKLFAKAASFSPSLKTPEPQILLHYLDCISQSLEKYSSEQRMVTLNLIVLPSIHDTRRGEYEYTWDYILSEFIDGKYLPYGFKRNIKINNLNIRKIFALWFPTEEEYTELFHKHDLHYTLNGHIYLSIAFSLLRGEFPKNWIAPNGNISSEKRVYLYSELKKHHDCLIEAFARYFEEDR